MRLLTPLEVELLSALGSHELPGREVAEAYFDTTEKRISYGTLYTTLSRLRDRGLVTVRDDTADDARVRFFAISGAGSKSLRHARAEYSRLADLLGDAVGGVP